MCFGLQLVPALVSVLGPPAATVMETTDGAGGEAPGRGAGEKAPLHRSWRLFVIEQANLKTWNKVCPLQACRHHHLASKAECPRRVWYNAGFDWLWRHARRRPTVSEGNRSETMGYHPLGVGGVECFCFHDVDFLPQRVPQSEWKEFYCLVTPQHPRQIGESDSLTVFCFGCRRPGGS